MKDLLKEKLDDYNDLLKNKAEAKDIMGLFTFTESKEKFSFCFSEELHHTAIKIS
jgi:hypothetical protein